MSARDVLAKALHRKMNPRGEWPAEHGRDGYCFDLADALLASPAIDAVVAERVAALVDELEPVHGGSMTPHSWASDCRRCAISRVADVLTGRVSA